MKARIVDSAVAGGSDGAIMSTEDAELVIKTIYHRPDTRLASLGGVDSDIAKSNAIYNVVKSASEGKTINNLEAFSATVKKNALLDIERTTHIKEKDVTTGEAEYRTRMISGDAATNVEGGSTIIDLMCYDPTPASNLEEKEADAANADFMKTLWAEAKKLDGVRGKVFRLYMAGFVYRFLYGRSSEKFSTEGIASKLGLTATGVSTHIRRAKIFLEHQLRPLGVVKGVLSQQQCNR